ncbi:hypothetical protein JKP88DRAFT_274921 [Tribonema minus]|uniref:Uncharacterized protein n=1 Tax=Tribonema minus TaxID=303371 RepID=A0A835ZGW3_9STRA|nr:hypothetical protein JKP88DRAFT_274921 [Tribonema minus]
MDNVLPSWAPDVADESYVKRHLQSQLWAPPVRLLDDYRPAPKPVQRTLPLPPPNARRKAGGGGADAASPLGVQQRGDAPQVQLAQPQRESATAEAAQEAAATVVTFINAHGESAGAGPSEASGQDSHSGLSGMGAFDAEIYWKGKDFESFILGPQESTYRCIRNAAAAARNGAFPANFKAVNLNFNRAGTGAAAATTVRDGGEVGSLSAMTGGITAAAVWATGSSAQQLEQRGGLSGLFPSEDGTIPIPRSVYRVDFAAGPMGMELQCDAHRGLVSQCLMPTYLPVLLLIVIGRTQQRGVLRGGQAAANGRVRAGHLILAAGGWRASARPANRVVVRSLADFEGIAVGRDPDVPLSIFFLDPDSPEAVQAFWEEDALHCEGGYRAQRQRSAEAVAASMRRADSMIVRRHARARDIMRSDDGSAASAGGCDSSVSGGGGGDGNCGSSEAGGDGFNEEHEEDAEQGNGWGFATGGGILESHDAVLSPPPRDAPAGDIDSDDDGQVAARVRRSEGAVPASSQSPPPPQPPPLSLPLSMGASKADVAPVFLCFSNAHATMKLRVGWLDYGGQNVPRRVLLPGQTYFERSFASHPWLLQAMGPSGTGSGSECVAVRCGADAVAAGAGLAFCAMWDPLRRSVSVMPQAKGSSSHARLMAAKHQILEEMRQHRSFDAGSLAFETASAHGLSSGIPHLRVVMVGAQQPRRQSSNGQPQQPPWASEREQQRSERRWQRSPQDCASDLASSPVSGALDDGGGSAFSVG